MNIIIKFEVALQLSITGLQFFCYK